MSTPCGIFWDIENVQIPRKSSADEVVGLIKSEIIQQYHLFRRDFYVAGKTNTISHEDVRRLEDLGATFELAGEERNAADEMIKKRMTRFIANFDGKCSVILITKDKGIAKPLKELKPNSLLKVYFIRLDSDFGEDLKEIADRIFLLKPSKLEMIYESKGIEHHISTLKSFTSNEWRMKYFVMISCEDSFFSPKLLHEIRNDLTFYGGSYVILSADDEIWCTFDDIQYARSAFDLKGSYTYNGKKYTISIDIKSAPMYVINLMECAKLSGQMLVNGPKQNLNMPQYKEKTETSTDRRASTSSSVGAGSTSDFMETINNVSETFSAMQSIYASIKSTPGTRSNQSRNSQTKDEGCKQS